MKRLAIFAAVIVATFGTLSIINTRCGNQTIKPHQSPSSAKIVGGREAIPHSWPWQVLIRYRTSTLTCGGALIRNKLGEIVVVTAAHCVDGTENRPGDWTIDTGVHSRSAHEQNQLSYYVQSIISHNQYNSRTFDNDIAIIKLSQIVAENDAVSPICVPSVPSSEYWRHLCVVTGWGTTSEVGALSDKLQEVYIPVLTDVECNRYLSNSYNHNTMLCAGFDAGGKDNCDGDTGGPLACLNRNGLWDLVGIASVGYGCARPRLPRLYTDVHAYVGWIGLNA
ncbi:trypsin-1-like isoform X2 [Mytilus galloprovincialis]|uniref:trypsin-1-like isoform X2 n=1 Tax=Mytilus galloprovincialis TaxID=29158 RepID=UPI003F7B872C